jgi:hypothetical protein
LIAEFKRRLIPVSPSQMSKQKKNEWVRQKTSKQTACLSASLVV